MTRDPSVLIVGAGFGGLAMALELKRHGHHNFTILEQGDDLGGVWRDNSYPGAACDAPSPFYSFSFASNDKWSLRFAERDEIYAYIQKVAKRFGLLRHIRFGVEVSGAEFDEDSGVWRINTADGETFTADVFVPAVGQLSRPVTPKLPGAESFTGAQFHSAQWDHSVDLAGKRVAIIGTGASAIQIVPAIQPEVAHLTLFQRSAPWIIPKLDRFYLPSVHPVMSHVPFVQQAERLGWYAFFEAVTSGLEGNGKIAEVITAWANGHRDKQVTDPVLKAKITPDYEAGCKRGLMSNIYYPTLMQNNVDVETNAITEITPTGIVTADGVEHPVDVIVYCTGFAATQFLAPMQIHGLGGKDLREVWSDGARAYFGMAVPHFPNMFIMYGPNTNLGAGSIIYMHERQARYIRQVVEYLAASRRRGTTLQLAVREDVEERFDADTQERLGRTVWTKCTSWYREANGRVTANWPGRMSEYDKRTKRFNPADYDERRSSTSTQAVGSS